MTVERAIQEQRLRLLKEKQRRINLPINQYTPDATPKRNQKRFHESTARYRIGFGGNRSGKSTMTSYEAAAWARGCHRFQELPPGPKVIYVISSEYRTIYQGVYRHLAFDEKGMKFIDKSWVKAIGPKVPGASVPLPSYIQVYCERYPNGQLVPSGAEDRPFSTIWFISGDGSEQARRKMQAAAVDLVIIDEEVSEEVFKELQMRLIDNDGRMAFSLTLVRSEEWLMNLEDRANEGDETICLVTLDTASSEHLPENAKKEIFKGLSREEYSIRVEGKSRRHFGLVYPDFNSNHIFEMSKRFPRGFPEDFQLICCNDPGFRTHAVLWAAVDNYTHSIYFYRELYCNEMPLHEVCQAIAKSEGYQLVAQDKSATVSVPHARIPDCTTPEKVSLRLIDPAAFRTSEAGYLGVAGQMAAFYDLAPSPANNDIDAGVMAMKRLLEVNPNTGEPHALFDTNLSELFRERRKYRYKRDVSGPNAHATKAGPVKKNDHLMDTMRYIGMYAMATFTGGSGKTSTSNFNNSMSEAKQDRLAAHFERMAENLRSSQGDSYVGSY